MELSRIERETGYPPRLSNEAIRSILSQLAAESERIEQIVIRLDYEMKLREGQGNA